MKTYYILITLLFLLTNVVIASDTTYSDQELFDKASKLNEKGNHSEAFTIYTLLADKGYAGAENNLGYMYKSGVGTERNYEKAIELYLRAAQKGYVHAQVNLAHMYGNGKGTKIDYKKAYFWLQKAADQDFPLAQYMLAGVYAVGLGVDKNLKTAQAYYKKACINKYADSCDKYTELNKTNEKLTRQ